MPHAIAFVEQFDQLVRLLATAPESLEAHKSAIRAARDHVSSVEVTFVAEETGLRVNGAPAIGSAVEPGGLLDRLRRCGVERLTVARDAAVTDLLIVARALATEGPLTELDLRTVRATALRPAIATAESVFGEGTVLLRPALAADARELDTPELVARIGAGQDLTEITLCLEELSRRVDAAVRADDAVTVFRALHALVLAERRITERPVRLAAGVVMRRLLAPPILRHVARLVPRLPDEREALLLVLERAEADGPDALLELLGAAESQSDRRAYYNAVLQLPASEAALVHMLGDQRWYVVRNAADMIGDLGLRGADGVLVSTLQHPDERVRRSVLAALGRLGTVAAWSALRDAMQLPEPALRAAAATALAESGCTYALPVLRRALGEERDLEARAAMIAALGRVGTEEAVTLVAGYAEASRGLLRRNPTAVRLAAVQALASAATPSARGLLTKLARDRNGEVMSAASRALSRLRPAAARPSGERRAKSGAHPGA